MPGITRAPKAFITIFQPFTVVYRESGTDVFYLWLPKNRTLKLWKVMSSRMGIAPANPPPPANSIVARIETLMGILDERDIWGNQPYTQGGGAFYEGSPLASWSFTEETLIIFTIDNGHTVDVTTAVAWVISID